MNREIYKKITGVDGLNRALIGLDAAIENKLEVKINVSIVNGLNNNEVFDLIEFAKEKGVALQLIELQPVNSGMNGFNNLHYPLSIIEEKLIKNGAKLVLRKLHNRPIYVLPNGVKVEIVKSYDNPIFCAGCMRVRLLANGTLIPCINWKGPGIPLLPRIKNKPRSEAVKGAITAFIDVNSIRRPYTLYKLDTSQVNTNGKDLRIKLPKKNYNKNLLQ